MTRRTAHTNFVIASLLTFALVALTAAPAAAGGLWRAKAAEDVAIRLTNCMRSGGYVTRVGTCKGWGKGNFSKAQPALKRSDRLSDQVSWPWARKSVQFYGARSCWIGHTKDGSTVNKRFASASLTDHNGENMGCGMFGTAKQTVVRMVRMWQSEKSWGGPHWRQIKDPDFKSIGVGVTRYGNRKTQIIMNFYGKKLD